MAVNIFFMGKGGVGKSTSAALNAVYLSDNGCNVLLVSLDPAHNLSDIFCQRLTHNPSKITQGLHALEIDQNRWIRSYLNTIQKQVKKTYSYLSALNLDHYFKIIRHSPGLEEHALLMAFNHYQEKYSDVDFMIFDMPPTALALKFFQLPSLSLVWMEQLLELRREIIRKRDLITKIKLMKKEVERDKILNRIMELHEEYNRVKQIFQDRQRTRIHLVMNTDELSLAESLRILEGLKDIDIQIEHLVHNMTDHSSLTPRIKDACPDIPILEFPDSETPLIGMENLRGFLNRDNQCVASQLHACHMS